MKHEVSGPLLRVESPSSHPHFPGPLMEESQHFLFLSLDAALIGDLAWQVAREGHDVRYYIEAEGDREIADGFVGPEESAVAALVSGSKVDIYRFEAAGHCYAGSPLETRRTLEIRFWDKP